MAANRFSQIADAFEPEAELQEAAQPVITTPDEIALHASSDHRLEDPFDHKALDLSPEQCEQLKTCRRRIVTARHAAIVEVGRELAIARNLLKKQHLRAAWTRWLAALEISESSARNFLATAEWAAKASIVEELPPSLIYQAARACPELQASIVHRLKKARPWLLNTLRR